MKGGGGEDGNEWGDESGNGHDSMEDAQIESLMCSVVILFVCIRCT